MTEHKITITIDTKPALEAIAVIKTALADLTVSGVPKQKLADEEYENDFLPIWDNWETAIAEGRATKKGNIKPVVKVESDGVVGGFGLGEQGEDIKVEDDRFDLYAAASREHLIERIEKARAVANKAIKDYDSNQGLTAYSLDQLIQIVGILRR